MGQVNKFALGKLMQLGILYMYEVARNLLSLGQVGLVIAGFDQAVLGQEGLGRVDSVR